MGDVYPTGGDGFIGGGHTTNGSGKISLQPIES
jgi:hypothetical protein